MANVSIRNLPNGVVERLKAKAKLHGRSLEAELREILERASRLSEEEFWRVAERISGEMGPQTTDSADLIREDRDSR